MFTIASSGSGATFDVVSMYGFERVCEPCEFEVEGWSAAAALRGLVGSEANLTLGAERGRTPPRWGPGDLAVPRWSDGRGSRASLPRDKRVRERR